MSKSNRKTKTTSKNDIYNVEKVLNKRVRKGETQYLIKWEDFSDEHNTWEPAKNVLCPGLIKSFEEKSQAQEKAQVQKRNLIPEKVVGVSKCGKDLMYMLKWKDVDEADLITSKQARAFIPDLVLAYYENNISLS